jgi:hypothetical protein
MPDREEHRKAVCGKAQTWFDEGELVMRPTLYSTSKPCPSKERLKWYNDACTLFRRNRGRHAMGDKGGRKNKEKSQKQKEVKHVHDVQQQKDKQQKSPFEVRKAS